MGSIVEDAKLKGKRFVFKDRKEAGKALGTALEAERGKRTIVLAIPSGGLPVAAEVAWSLGAQLDVVIVRKLQIPRNPEAGFGAISLDGDTILNADLVTDLALTPEQIDRSKENAMREGRSRERALRGNRPTPQLAGSVVIIVDDGLASGYTMMAAVKAVKKEHPAKIVVAIPTGSERSVEMVAKEVDQVVCLNIRGMPFAVADAYRNWYDVDVAEAAQVLRCADRS